MLALAMGDVAIEWGQQGRGQAMYGGEPRAGIAGARQELLGERQVVRATISSARLNLPNMRAAPERRLDAYAAAMRGLMSREDDPENQLKYFAFIDMYADLDENERARYEREYPQGAKIMSRFAEPYIQQGLEHGIQQGKQQGIQEGRQDGEALILLRQLQLKFGALPEAVRQRRFCCVNFRHARSDNRRAESGRQRIELLRGGQLLSVGCEHLALIEHVHELDACQRAPSRPEGLESESMGRTIRLTPAATRGMGGIALPVCASSTVAEWPEPSPKGLDLLRRRPACCKA